MTEAEWRNSLSKVRIMMVTSILDGKHLYRDAFETSLLKNVQSY